MKFYPRSGNILYSTPRFDVCLERRSIGGHEKEFYYVDKPDAVLVITTDGVSVVLLEVERMGVEGKHLELPGGRIDEGEQPMVAAQRELYEETGLRGISWNQVNTIQPLPSVVTEKVHIFETFVRSFDDMTLEQNAGTEGICGLLVVPITRLLGLLLEQRVACSVDAYALFQFLGRNTNLEM